MNYFFSLIIIFSLFGDISRSADDRQKTGKCDQLLAAIYATDNHQELKETVDSRSHLYRQNLRADWEHSAATIHRTESGEEVLTIEGFEVMRGFERPYMEALAKTVTSQGGRVLNVGFGLGLIDSAIESLRGDTGLREHHIIELNREVYDKALQWREQQPDKEQIFVHLGDWQNLLPEFRAQNLDFDGIIYDAFPLEAQDLHRDFIPFFEMATELRLARETTGIVTFYMDSPDGLGTSFVTYLQSRGVKSVQTTRLEIELPAGGTQYWNKPFYFVPMLTGIHYE